MIGSRLGAYEILAELGSGGMGKVYRAEATKAVAGLDAETQVALKVIHAHLLETPGFFKRFLREAELGRTIAHENVVRTLDCDALLYDGVQHNFLVMEYVEGQTLRDLLRELERVPEELCRHIGREVAKGLAAIHEAGVVHRDLKPENVLITPDHVVKVMDLGVARQQDETHRLSQAGAFVGSLEYAAPEQFRTADGEPDGRADLHALGVVLYELATGRHPYRDGDASSVLRNILDVTPRKAGEVNPQLSPFFEEAVGTLMAKERDRRFGTASDLALVLERGEKSNWWADRARALRVETERPLRRIRIPRETALYGRDEELAKLRTCFDRAKAGDGRVLLIEGEAGIGKTRIVDEFVARLREDGQDVNFLYGSYPPGGAATVAGAFSTAYREHFGEEGLEETLRRHLTVTPLLVPAFAALLKGDARPADAEPLTKESLQTVFAHATRALAAERTTVVLIDDLHFAPEDGRALFSSLAIAVPDHRVLLIGTLRRAVHDTWTASVTRLGHVEPLPLTRLGPKDLGRLLVDAFRSQRLATELGFQIAAKSDGNPFFAFEIIRGLREGQFISQQPDGTWVTTKVIQDIQIPSSVTDLIQARIADLDEGEKNLLDVASCCGFEFDPLLVAAVLGLDRIPAMQRLARLEQKHRLVRSAGRHYVFDHHQIQESLYAALPEILRESYHAAIADALEAGGDVGQSTTGGPDGTRCVELCEHFLRGAEGTRALRYLDEALGHLEHGYLHDKASGLAERALEMPRLLEGRDRVSLLLRRNRSLQMLGRRDAQEAILDDALGLAEQADDPLLVARVRIERGSVVCETSRYELARDEYGIALELARTGGDAELQGRALRGLGSALTNLGRFGDAVTQLERGLAISHEIGDEEGEARFCNGLAWAFFQLGRTEEEEHAAHRMLEIGEALGNRSLTTQAEAQLGNAAALKGRYEQARVLQERCVAHSRAIGDRAGEAVSAGNLAITIDCMGLSEEALWRYESSRLISREVGKEAGEATKLRHAGALLTHLGALDEAKSSLRTAIEIVRGVGRQYYLAGMLVDLGCCVGEEDDAESAERLFREAIALYDELGVRGGSAAGPRLSCGALLARVGRGDEGRALLREALSLATEADVPAARVPAFLHLALLEGGDAAEASQCFAEGEARLPHVGKIEARYLLFKLTGDEQHLRVARDLLAFFVDHAPDAYRESMLKNVRLHREIMEAWTEHGGGEQSVAPDPA